MPRRCTSQHGPACSRFALRAPGARPTPAAPDVGAPTAASRRFDAPPLHVVTRPGVLALRAPRAGGPPDAGCAGRGGPDGCVSPVCWGIASQRARCDEGGFGSHSLPSPTDDRPARDAHELRERGAQRLFLVPAAHHSSSCVRLGPHTLRVSAELVARDLAAAVAAIAAACRQADLSSRTKEPRSLPSAAGEVELPHRGAEAARPQGQRELQGDAGRPHDNQRHQSGDVHQDAQCTRERPSLAAEGGLRGDGPTRLSAAGPVARPHR